MRLCACEWVRVCVRCMGVIVCLSIICVKEYVRGDRERDGYEGLW